MEPEIERELIEKIKELYGKMSLKQIQEKLSIPRHVLMYLIGKAGLPLRQERVQSITVVRWRPTREGGSAPVLRVSRRIVRKLGLRDGDKVMWTIKDGKIIGIPLTRREKES